MPQDVPGLIALFGGREKFAEKLDTLFTFKNSEKQGPRGRAGPDRRVLPWQRAQPPHHLPLFLRGQPWKAAQRLHEVVRTQYGNQPDSLSGNDDCGQMSAWYLFTVMGFYPVCPASDYYVMGSPGVKRPLHLSNGATFTMTAENLSDANIYVQSVRLNGKKWDSPFLPFDAVERRHIGVHDGPPAQQALGTNGRPPQ